MENIDIQEEEVSETESLTFDIMSHVQSIEHLVGRIRNVEDVEELRRCRDTMRNTEQYIRSIIPKCVAMLHGNREGQRCSKFANDDGYCEIHSPPPEGKCQKISDNVDSLLCGYPCGKDIYYEGMCISHCTRNKPLDETRCIYIFEKGCRTGFQCENFPKPSKKYCTTCINKKSVIEKLNKEEHEKEYKYVMEELKCLPYLGTLWHEYVNIGRELVKDE